MYLLYLDESGNENDPNDRYFVLGGVALFERRGTQWGAINNLADIPYFAPANESRLLQAADLVAHATWLLYERREARLLRALLPAFDVMDGTLQGLAHMRAPARRNRRPPPSPRRLHLT